MLCNFYITSASIRCNILLLTIILDGNHTRCTTDFDGCVKYFGCVPWVWLMAIRKVGAYALCPKNYFVYNLNLIMLSTVYYSHFFLHLKLALFNEAREQRDRKALLRCTLPLFCKQAKSPFLHGCSKGVTV